MNLFNPKGQKNLEFSYYEDATERNSPSRTNRSYIGSIQEILNDTSGSVRMRNEDLQKKTEDVQNEFEQLMNEMN